MAARAVIVVAVEGILALCNGFLVGMRRPGTGDVYHLMKISGPRRNLVETRMKESC